jgi:hypothetical protein
MMKSITQILYSVISFLGLYKDPKEAKFKKLASHKCIEMKKWRYAPLFEYFTEQVCKIPLFRAVSDHHSV